MTQPPEVITGPETVEFRGSRRATRIALGDVDALGVTPEVLAERGDERIVAHCRRSGVAYQRLRFDGTRWRAADRSVPLFRDVEPNGFRRTFTARLHPLGGVDLDHSIFGLDLEEEFTDPAATYPDDLLPAYSYTLSIDYEQLGRLADLLESRFGATGREHLDDRAAALLTGLAGRHELGPHLLPGVNRELLAGWCRESGVRPRWGGTHRRHVILEVAGGPLLEVVFCTSFGHRPEVQFTEAYREAGRRFGGTEYQVVAPLDAVPQVTGAFEGWLGEVVGPGRADDRMILALRRLVEEGLLGPTLPRRANRDEIAGLMKDAGVPVTVRGHSREERLLHVYREDTDCLYDLVLIMDSTAHIAFTEKYEYLPRRGDAGRLYSYGVRTPYASMSALLGALEPGPGDGGDVEDRLTRCFRSLVTGGELTGTLGLREARDRVVALFGRAGVPAEETSSQWVNSD